MLIEQRAVFAVCAFLLAIPALANDAANSEAIRVEIEHLRETGRLSLGSIDIASGNALESRLART